MKQIIKIIIVLTLIINISCNSDENQREYGKGYNSGWLEMAGYDDDNDSDTDAVFETTINHDEVIKIPVKLNAGTNDNGLKVTYDISLEDGFLDDTSILGERTFMIEKDALNDNIEFTPILSSGFYKLKFTLVSTDDGEFQVGLSDDSQPIDFILNVTNIFYFDAVPVVNYSGTDYVAPEYIAGIAHVGGTTSDYTISDLWGPHYAFWFTGNPTYDNIPNPGTFTLNADNTISNVEGDYVTSGTGSGTFDPATGNYDITYTDSVWSGIIHVVLTKQ